jgi:hypothetical protein
MNSYVNLLVSVLHPTFNMTICRYCVGIDLNDPLMQHFDIDHWAAPEMRKILLSMLCDDWLSEDCCIIGCEQIAGSVQWQRVSS